MDQWVEPGVGSTVAFVVICLSVVAMVAAGIRRAEPSRAGQVRLGLIGWVLGTGLLASALPSLPVVAVFGFFGLCNVLAVFAAVTGTGRALATLPAAWLVGFHAFRLPLEIVLHRWFVEGTLPVQMTWEGENLDVITGVLALGIGLWGVRAEPPRAVVWAFEAVGVLLLLNVMRVAVLSAPTPIRAFANDPPVLLAWHLPYAWIVPLCVSAALFGHIVLARKLLGR